MKVKSQMKITVEVGVPSGDYRLNNNCQLFHRGLRTYKCPACLIACQEAKQQETKNPIKHTMEENFQHFLSVSGLRNETEETISKLLKAFEFNYEDK